MKNKIIETDWENVIDAEIDIKCLYLSLYHCNALVYENKES
jgi:hypothetical protein